LHLFSELLTEIFNFAESPKMPAARAILRDPIAGQIVGGPGRHEIEEQTRLYLSAAALHLIWLEFSTGQVPFQCSRAARCWRE